MIKENKTFNNLLLFSLFSISLWFFGNLYEAIVIAPNMLKDSIRKVQIWQAFFINTNPVFFYIPLTPPAVIILIFLYFKTTAEKAVLKNYLKFATIFLLFAFVLGVYIITQINFKLFFGDMVEYVADAHQLAVRWNILNALRVVLLAVALYYTFRAYICTQQKLE